MGTDRFSKIFYILGNFSKLFTEHKIYSEPFHCSILKSKNYQSWCYKIPSYYNFLFKYTNDLPFETRKIIQFMKMVPLIVVIGGNNDIYSPYFSYSFLVGPHCLKQTRSSSSSLRQIWLPSCYDHNQLIFPYLLHLIARAWSIWQAQPACWTHTVHCEIDSHTSHVSREKKGVVTFSSKNSCSWILFD